MASGMEIQSIEDANGPNESARSDSAVTNQQASLLGLPRELRDLIFHNLLHHSTPPPKDPCHAGDRNPSTSSPCTIYFEAHSPRPALLQLKLCSRQLYCEIHELTTKHVPLQTGPAELDIMIQGSSIWPTWTRLPVTTHLDPSIRITLRIFKAEGWDSEFSTGAYRALWTFFRLLVYHGPCLNHATRALSKPLQIERLKFEIVLGLSSSIDDLFGTYKDVFAKLEKLASDDVGMGHVGMIEGALGADRRVWKLRQSSTGLTVASRARGVH